MPKQTRRERDRKRRTTVARYHQVADASEQYEVDMATATSDEERRRIMHEFSAFRRAHREEDVRRGKRPKGKDERAL